jgi:hypothetical protein
MNKINFLYPSKTRELAAGQVQSAPLGGKRQALGDITFTAQPAAGETFVLKGHTFTARAAGAVANEFNIGVSLTLSIDALVASIAAALVVENAAIAAGLSAVPAVIVPKVLGYATYSNVGGTKLHVLAVNYGADGNLFTLAEVSANATVSAATLTGGTDADKLDLDAETKALSTVAGTTVTEFDLPIGGEGQETTFYLASKGAGSNAQINGAFVGGTKLTLDTVGKFAKLKYLGSTWVALVSTGAIS